MKPRISYFFWILILAFGLMILVVATQLFTKENINGLKKGNREAVITFTINNELQNLVNLSFELETKVINSRNRVYNKQLLTDSLTMLGYNGSVLEQINLNEEVTARFKKLNGFIGHQIESSLRILQNNSASGAGQIDSLRKLQITDSIYVTALAIQKYLEKDLQNTLNNNTTASTRLTAYNQTLAIIAIAAVLILGTIIINRHLRQVQLISALEKATVAAKKSAQIKEQFLANMSHEIRTPLNAIKGFSRLISQTPLSREQQEYAGLINDASGSLIHIVNDILDISKIEAGKLRIEEKDFNLEKILQTVEHLFINVAAEKQLEFSSHINDDVPLHLKGDPERLSQILINLINNGIKFTEAGYVRTMVRVNKEEKEKVWLEFKVEDSGIGIPADKQNTIFQRFEQLNTNIQNITAGTGLGLSIVKSLTELMGGTIFVSGEESKGTVFTVALPFEKRNSTVVSEKKTVFKPTYFYSGVSVMVVEDNKVNQFLLKHTLAELNISATIVSNGQEALDTVCQNEFDLILLDIQMPVMDGYTTIEALRNKLNIKTPVVAMTAYAMPGEKEKCLAAGMDEYLSKPVDFQQLINVLERFLKTDKTTEQEPAPLPERENNFLLSLSGGDRSIAFKIMKEIYREIPHAVSWLSAVRGEKDFKEVSTICHHMFSTFAPIGNEIAVMKKIKQLNSMIHIEDNRNTSIKLIDSLVQELHILEQELKVKIEAGNLIQ